MTKKERSGRDKLLEAMCVSEKSYCDQFSSAEGELRYTENYLRYMEMLLQKARKPIRRQFKTFRRYVAGIAAALLILFGCSMTVSAVREPVVEFFTNIYEKFVEIVFGEEDVAEAPSTIETVYTLGTVPEEYVFEKSIAKDTLRITTWKNDDGRRLVLTQGTLKNSMTLDAEESNYLIFESDDGNIAFIQKNGVLVFYWNFEEYEFQLIVPDSIPEDDAAKLIDSIVEIGP